ncbi:MAG: hypothetical protein L3J71_16185 [Victivallaceae bacterium]|nr:hypothetical protein [Victivallaceae bacterium]
MFDDFGFLIADFFATPKLLFAAAIVLNIRFDFGYYNYVKINTREKKLWLVLLAVQFVAFNSYIALGDDIYFLGVKSRVYWFRKENNDYLKSLSTKIEAQQKISSNLNKIELTEQVDLKWWSLGQKYNGSSLLLIDNNIYLFSISHSKVGENSFLIYSLRALDDIKLSLEKHFGYFEIIVLKKSAPNLVLPSITQCIVVD